MNEAVCRLISCDDKLITIIKTVTEDDGITLIVNSDVKIPDDVLTLVDIDSVDGYEEYTNTVLITKGGKDISSYPYKYLDVVRRPFDLAGFVRLIKDTCKNIGVEIIPLDKTENEPSDLRYNGKTKEMMCGGKKVCITPYEHSIFDGLMKNRGRAVGYDEMCRATGITDENNLRVHICSLRKKLEELTGNRTVCSVHNKGYMIK